MANDGNADRDTDCLVSTPMLVSHVGTEKGHTINPESVECVDAIGGLRALAESARDALVTASTSTGVTVRTWGT